MAIVSEHFAWVRSHGQMVKIFDHLSLPKFKFAKVLNLSEAHRQ